MIRRTTATRTRPAPALESPSTVLRRRRDLVFAAPDLSRSATAHTGREQDGATAGATAGAAAGAVTALEADLVERGYLLSPALRDRLTGLDPWDLTQVGSELLVDIDAHLGADRPHVPLFRSFPHNIPQDTLAFYVDRVLTVLLQVPDAPCVLCGERDSVHPVSPCAHLVCRSCFDGANFSACPICHRRIDLNDPFLRPSEPRPTEPHPARATRWPARGQARRVQPVPAPTQLRVLGLGDDIDLEARTELCAILARTGAPTPAEVDDLRVLLGTQGSRDLTWIPSSIPSRESKAHVLAWLLTLPVNGSDEGAGALAAAGRLATTATDVLRTLVVLSGGDAGLNDVPRFAPVTRPVRRRVLALLDALTLDLLAEDVQRHAGLWKRAAERLHPFEHVATYPHAAAAFAALRRTRLRGDQLDRHIRSAVEGTTAAGAGAGTREDVVDGSPARGTSATVTLGPDTVTVASFAARVEAALRDGDVVTATRLLRARPGEMFRRADHLLRLAATAAAQGPGGDPTRLVVDALTHAAPRVAPAVLLSALGELRGRAGATGAAGEPTSAAGPRVFFPKGGSARVHLLEETREPLPADLVEQVVDVLTREVVARAATRGAADVAVVDAGLDSVIAPFTQRTASRALVTLPRGSALPLPTGQTLRLFLHWMENKERVDLDLSVAMFDADWSHVGTCDYTQLRFADRAAVHSGDLTSAPPPLGASEFADLDLEALAATGTRYVVAVVFSFNNVAFEDMAEAFAGLMVLDDAAAAAGPAFQPGRVEQRFDLTGRSRACVPLVLDLEAGTMRWFDVAKGVTGTGHAVHRYGDDLAQLGHALTGHFTSGSRVSVGELATWTAAARARTVVVREVDGSTLAFQRSRGEDPVAFASRIRARDGATSVEADRLGSADLTYLLRADVALVDGGEMFTLYPGGTSPETVRVLGAVDLVDALAPRSPETPQSPDARSA